MLEKFFASSLNMHVTVEYFSCCCFTRRDIRIKIAYTILYMHADGSFSSTHLTFHFICSTGDQKCLLVRIAVFVLIPGKGLTQNSF